MSNGRDNIAGYSLTVGTADVVITDTVAQYDPIIGNLPDGAVRPYKFQFLDSSVSGQYETGVGSWNAGSSTWLRTTVKTSSNGGAKENFGAGPKVLFIVSDYESLTDMDNMVESATKKILTVDERQAILQFAVFDTVADMLAYTGATIGQSVRVLNYSATCQSGVLFFKAVALGTSPANTGSFIDGTGVQWKQLFGPIMALSQWGCGDGSGNDSARAQTAFDYAGYNLNFSIPFPTKVIMGAKQLVFTTTVTVPAGITFQGNHGGPNGIFNYSNPSTILLGPGASIRADVSSCIDGVEILSVVSVFTFPCTLASVNAWTGTAIEVFGAAVTISNCSIGGFAQAIKSSGAVSQFRAVNVHIDCLAGVWCDTSVDVDRCTGVHCWPWMSQGLAAANFARSGAAFRFTNSDNWPRLTDCFEYGYAIGYRFTDCPGAALTACADDGVPGATGKRSILIEDSVAGANTSVQVSNHFFRSSMASAIEVNVTDTSNKHAVLINNSLFYGQDLVQQINLVNAEHVTLTGNIFQQQGSTAKLISIGADMGLILTATGNLVQNQTVPPLANVAAGYTTNDVLWDDSNIITGSYTELWTNGADEFSTVASAATIQLPARNDYIKITGTTTITAIRSAQKDRRVTLEFGSNITLNQGATIKLKTSANTAYLANARANFICTGTAWYEV